MLIKKLIDFLSSEPICKMVSVMDGLVKANDEQSLQKHDDLYHEGHYEEGEECKLRDFIQEKNEGEELGSNSINNSVISSEEDEEYMDAVNSGNLDKCYQMVVEAFKKTYPKTVAVDENGEPRKLFHGTSQGTRTATPFTVFKKSNDEFSTTIRKITGNKGFNVFFFTSRNDVADSYGKRTIPVFLNIEKPVEYEGQGDDDQWQDMHNYWKTAVEESAYMTETEKKLGELLREIERNHRDDEYRDYNGRAEWTDEEKREWQELANRNQSELNRLAGEGKLVELKKQFPDAYDGFIGYNIMDLANDKILKSDIFAVVKPNQIKSAEPITYDNNGNPIPLSKRFGKGNDIRGEVV